MLVLKLEDHPGGDATRAQEIGSLEIRKVGGRWDAGEYTFALFTEHDRSCAAGHFRGYPRSLGAWELVRRCLDFAAPLPPAPPEHASGIAVAQTPTSRRRWRRR